MMTDATPKPSSLALADERERDLAATNDAALVVYQRKWERKLARLQRAHPQRWHVPGLSDEEVRDALTLRLIEAIRQLPTGPSTGCPSSEGHPGGDAARPEREWGLRVALARLAELRRSFRLAATPVDFAGVPLPGRHPNHSLPSHEEHWLELEHERCLAQAEQRAHARLSGPQRRWLDALKSAAHDGDFFEASDRLNLSAASRRLGMNRSSASRAYEGLQTCFTRELERWYTGPQCSRPPQSALSPRPR
jgi:hypothetical protein